MAHDAQRGRESGRERGRERNAEMKDLRWFADTGMVRNMVLTIPMSASRVIAIPMLAYASIFSP